ncbi:MAG: undecaprenyl/decaprenyl-phosphate alpha-N-acetylglucosaminyl 1-phosphate transferase [Anaerolineae bacterium]|nr:undecaprenyl/decaprenyl-phosphate alpha-N-acetylglucosaminyl 1-phosphate transferase [Anaerolineae bacterium]
MMYITVFLAAFVLALMITPIGGKVGQTLGLTDRPGGRRTHRGEISRLGGMALFAGFMGAGLLVFGLSAFEVWPPIGPEDRKLLAGVLLGSSVIFMFGWWDDWRELSVWPQFAAQLGVALIAIGFDIIIERATLPIFGFKIFPPWLTYPLTIFWIMGMINTVNWLDGLDGLAAGVTAIASLLFAVHAYSLGQTMVALFPLALAAACLGFLPFNFYPARVFMGSGSMFLGFALASLSILAPAKVATALLVLGIPIIDVAWVMIRRWQQRGNPAAAGRDHLHYRLLDLGLSQRQIVSLYYLFCATFGLLALLIEVRLFKLIALGVMGSLTLILLWWLARQDGQVTK